MKIARITVTPVKGTALHHPNEVMLEVYGVAENRRFFLVDQQGALLNNSKVPQLMQVRVDYESDREHLSFHFPDSSIAEGSAVAVFVVAAKQNGFMSVKAAKRRRRRGDVLNDKT